MTPLTDKLCFSASLQYQSLGSHTRVVRVPFHQSSGATVGHVIVSDVIVKRHGARDLPRGEGLH
jgi:hypothetical protein